MSSLSHKLEQFIFADLLAVTILSPLAYGTVEAWSIALFELNALLLAILLSLRLIVDKSVKLRWHRLLWPLIALLLLGSVQMIRFPESVSIYQATGSWTTEMLTYRSLSFDPYSTQQAVVRLLALLIYFIAWINVLHSRERWRRLLYTAVIFGVSLAIFAIAQKLTWNGKLYWVRPLRDGAPFGPFVNYNHYAGLMEMIFPLCFAALPAGFVRRELKALWFVASVLMASSIVISLSRGGVLSLGVELIFFTLLSIWWRQRSAHQGKRGEMNFRLLIPLTLAMMTVFALWVSYDQIAGRLQHSAKGLNEPSAANRLEIWRNALRLFRDYPLTGVGLGAFPVIYPQYGRSSALRERLEQTHNDYLQLLTDAGLIGGAIGLWFLIELILLARQQIRTDAEQESSLQTGMAIGSLIGITGLMVHSLTDFNLQIPSNAFYFVLMLAIAASSYRTTVR
jgi:O-antigen ligase